ncbi:DNA ligase [Reinekea marinisedimentorum]|uniref:DNA ligase-1 n=1 Tax=Reinekea marinisedimentorum TaxID=230495 RepID=A0A4R3HWT3_9GAMM|nr:DNA ligase [Reinekea marinisedimentorum]TCS37598.1 DNA ligase-1 [Reinekea marinisedimentorum]
MPAIFCVLLFCVLVTLPVAVVAAQSDLPLMKARELTTEVDIRQFSVSEKYDGVRALWTGQHLLTRSGHVIAAPEWLTAGLPEATAVEGELWLGRGRFDEVSALVRRYDASDAGWQQVRFMVFDLPYSTLNYSQRMAQLEQLQQSFISPALKLVPRFTVEDQAALDAALAKVVADGGEGLMLNRVDALYQPVRSGAILKYKPEYDAEAEVVGYSPGQGKYAGMMGSLIVRDELGRSFKIGTGFTDAERASPPAIGERVSYQYSGFTSSGLPKFPRFLRVYREI